MIPICYWIDLYGRKNLVEIFFESCNIFVPFVTLCRLGKLPVFIHGGTPRIARGATPIKGATAVNERMTLNEDRVCILTAWVGVVW